MDTCVMCGGYVAEGSQVCVHCEYEILQKCDVCMHEDTDIDSKNNNGVDILKSSWEVFNEKQVQEFTLSNILVDFGCKLINYRLDNNISQKDLAKKLDIPKAILIQLEKGEYNPTIKLLLDICIKLDWRLELNVIS